MSSVICKTMICCINKHFSSLFSICYLSSDHLAAGVSQRYNTFWFLRIRHVSHHESASVILMLYKKWNRKKMIHKHACFLFGQGLRLRLLFLVNGWVGNGEVCWSVPGSSLFIYWFSTKYPPVWSCYGGVGITKDKVLFTHQDLL